MATGHAQRYLTRQDFSRLLGALSEQYDVYVPSHHAERRFFTKYTGQPDEVVVGEVRPVDPLKALFLRPREQVAEGFSSAPPRSGDKPVCVVGAKACDLKGFKIQDIVFLNGDVRDPFYARVREQALIIAADCTCTLDTCFCVALGVKPFPEENFDIALAPVSQGFLVEVGSEKGRTLVAEHAVLFKDVAESMVAERDNQRRAVAQQVEGNLTEHAIPRESELEGAVQRQYDAPLWAKEAETCVECGACNTVCPTCHCFFLYDQQNGDRLARFRAWDSCLVKDFARVAGGANPRPELWMRLRNRFEKKFDFFPKTAGVYACTGCGRCISACPAKIDIRTVLRTLASHG